MSFTKVDNQETNREIKNIIDFIKNSSNCYQDKDYKKKFNKKLKKTINNLIENKQLLKTDNGNSYFAIEKNFDDKNIFDIRYWSKDYSLSNEELRDLISNKLSDDNNFNAIIYINKLDTYTLNYFNVEKIMLFQGQIFYSTIIDDSSDEEWFILPGFTKEDLMRVENENNSFSSNLNLEKDNYDNNKFNNSDKENNYEVIDKNIEEQNDINNYQENNYEVIDKNIEEQNDINNYQENNYEVIDRNAKEPNNINNNQENNCAKFNDGENLINDYDDQTILDDLNKNINNDELLYSNDDYSDFMDIDNQKDWYTEFYKLKGNKSNNITSTKERFDLNKIQKYEMMKNYCSKFDISDLNSLRKNSSVNFDYLSSKNSSYVKSRDKVEQQLEKLKNLNNHNKSLIYANSSENKLTTNDLINKIKELKK